MTEPGWLRDERIIAREENFNDTGAYKYRKAWGVSEKKYTIEELRELWGTRSEKSDLEEDECTQEQQS